MKLVARDKNHPSTIMWNVANEPMGGAPLGGQPVPSAVTAGMPFFRTLYDEAKRLDPTRPVTLVGVQGGVLDWHGIFDVVCMNRYFGWYTQPGQLDEAVRVLEEDLDELHRRFGKPVIITEVGTDNPAQRAQPAA
jgi:beta-glucuronidase